MTGAGNPFQNILVAEAIGRRFGVKEEEESWGECISRGKIKKSRSLLVTGFQKWRGREEKMNQQGSCHMLEGERPTI